MSVSSEVIRAVADVANLEEYEVSLTSKLSDDLGLDSLDQIELVMELEDFFDIEISDEEAGNCKTVADIVELVERIK